MKIVRRLNKVLIGCVALIALASTVSAQMRDVADLREIKSRSSISLAPAVSPFSLLDLSRLQWSHSYSMSFGSSRAGSGSFGLYTSSLSYEFSPVLSMALSLGISHDPGALFNQRRQANANLFPAMTLDYHPSNNFSMRLSIARSPYGPGYYGSQFPGSRSFGSPYFGSHAFGSYSGGYAGSLSPFYDPFGTARR